MIGMEDALKELKSLEDRLLQKGTGDDDCQSLRQDIIRVKGEMRKIDVEWKKRIETLHKEVGGGTVECAPFPKSETRPAKPRVCHSSDLCFKIRTVK